jgi:hypothetical protein
MYTIVIARKLTLLLPLGLIFLPASGLSTFAQGPCGGKPCPTVKVPSMSRPPGRTPRPPRPPRDGTPSTIAPASVCEDSDLVVVCGMRGCEISLEGSDSKRGRFRQLSKMVTDDLGGYTFQVIGNQFYRVTVTKPGYELFGPEIKKVDCDDQQELKAPLRAKPVTLRIRTQPAESDIYFEGQKQAIGKSDSSGLFTYLLNKPTLLIEARKKGYLSDTRTVLLAPEWASREVVLSLSAISATLQLTSNVQNARVTIDNSAQSKSVSERILLPHGQHSISVEALGYVPAKFDLSVRPEESVARQITLERLPLASLQIQAESLFLNRAYDDVLKLAQFMFEADAASPAAHRLVGLVHVERAEFANAQSHLEKALAGSEPVALRIRRHTAEKFELNKGHELCEAQLTLGKSDLEFRSTRNLAENFKVSYDQVQLGSIQLKSSTAAYLSTKVTVNGKRRDYNFYSFDRELSALGKPYLEMVQRLLRSH